MKRTLIILVILFIVTLLTNCKYDGHSLNAALTGELDTPYIFTYIEDEYVENIIKDAKITLTEITKEEYDQANNVNVLVEKLKTGGPITRYIKIDLKILIDESIGFQDVTIYDLKVIPINYTGTCMYEQNGKISMKSIDIFFYSAASKTYSVSIKICDKVYEDEAKYRYQSLQFRTPQLIQSCKLRDNMRNLSENDYFGNLEIKVITKEEYESANRINVFKQESYGIYKDVERYIHLNLQIENEIDIYDIIDLKLDTLPLNSYKGTVKATINNEIKYGDIEIMFGSYIDDIDVTIKFEDGEIRKVDFSKTNGEYK